MTTKVFHSLFRAVHSCHASVTTALSLNSLGLTKTRAQLGSRSQLQQLYVHTPGAGVGVGTTGIFRNNNNTCVPVPVLSRLDCLRCNTRSVHLQVCNRFLHGSNVCRRNVKSGVRIIARNKTKPEPEPDARNTTVGKALCDFECESEEIKHSSDADSVLTERQCQNLEGNVSMTRVLNVAEKNDAAKKISELMAPGRVSRKEGKSVYNKIYEFDYQLWGRPCKMAMTSVSGHLLALEFTGIQKAWSCTDPVELFDTTVAKYCPDNFKNIQQTLVQQARFASVLIIWTDCDREGENIGFEVISVCTQSNPRLQVYRAKFSEMTEAAIRRATSQLGQPNEAVSNAVDVRTELDLRIGASFTRFQTMRLQRKFASHLRDNLISYGPCQFPTLGFVVERYKAIQEFVPEDFWKIEVQHSLDGCSVDFKWARVRLYNERACLAIYEKVLDNPIATVTKITNKPKSKWRPTALDTVEFEKLASRKLKINAKEAMKIAEKLYTSGFISYPRTETNQFPKGLSLEPLIEMQSRDNRWGGFAANLLNDGPNPRNGKKSDQAHPPIHPTKYTRELQGNEAKIYELIVRHFLACCSKDALGHETTVEIEIAQEKFVGNGLSILERNYLEVYIYDKWSEKELPSFQEGERFQPTNIEMNESQTSPPNLLTEADLISLMEKHGIGTDATHAEHIETIKNRAYVGVQDDGRFVPGYLGMGLVEGYDSMGFEMSKPHLRAELEADLKRICDGVKSPQQVLAEHIVKYKSVFIEARRQVEKLDAAIGKFLPLVAANPVGPPPPPSPPRGGGGGRGQYRAAQPQNNRYPNQSNQSRPPFQNYQNMPQRGNSNFSRSPRSNTSRGSSRGQSTTTRGAPRSARRCGVCHQPGHTRRTCPQAAQDGNEDEEDDMFD